MKVMTIVGTRPEIIKLSSTLRELDKYEDIFTIISPLKTLHQSHPCPMLGRC